MILKDECVFYGGQNRVVLLYIVRNACFTICHLPIRPEERVRSGSVRVSARIGQAEAAFRRAANQGGLFRISQFYLGIIKYNFHNL